MNFEHDEEERERIERKRNAFRIREDNDCDEYHETDRTVHIDAVNVEYGCVGKDEVGHRITRPVG